MDNLKQDSFSKQTKDICADQCGAMCCRGALILKLSDVELRDFLDRASDMGLSVAINKSVDGGWIRFSDQQNNCCPMLDVKTNLCRIYRSRPTRCSSFPEKFTPGCLLSGWHCTS